MYNLPLNLLNLLDGALELKRQINEHAARINKPEIFSTTPKEGYKHLIGSTFGNTDYRLEGFGYVFPASLQFWVKHMPSNVSFRVVKSPFKSRVG